MAAPGRALRAAAHICGSGSRGSFRRYLSASAPKIPRYNVRVDHAFFMAGIEPRDWVCVLGRPCDVPLLGRGLELTNQLAILSGPCGAGGRFANLTGYTNPQLADLPLENATELVPAVAPVLPYCNVTEATEAVPPGSGVLSWV